MTDKVTAQEIGRRVRKFRQAKGWSQKELGEKIGTSGQNIHKYENELYNYEIIQELSAVLEVDLTKDEMDEEGEIGEIGIEILSFLVGESYDDEEAETGFVNANLLWNTNSLYGLSKGKIIHELSKLEKLGLCVREQFMDYRNEENDYIFITAKGVIALKRRVPSDTLNFANVKTYEMMCGDCDSIQDYIDSRPLEKELETIEFDSAFRYNFFAFVAKGLKPFRFARKPVLTNKIFNGISCYENILYSMMLNLTREEADLCVLAKDHRFPHKYMEPVDLLAEDYDEEDWGIFDDNFVGDSVLFMTDEEKELHNKLEEQQSDEYKNYTYGVSPEEDVITEFMGFLGYKHNDNYLIQDYLISPEEFDGDISDDLKRYLLLTEERENKSKKFAEKMRKRISKVDNIKEETDIREMFSNEQILDWVKKNVRKPSNGHEEMIQHTMEEALDKYASARNYFVFPKKWEEEGLADEIRKYFGVDEIMNKYPKNLAIDWPYEPIMAVSSW